MNFAARSRIRFALPTACALVVLAGACSSTTKVPGFTNPDATILPDLDGACGINCELDDAAARPDTPKGCAGLECQISKCETGKTTRIKGKVFDPGGKNPLYNVSVYIPNSTPKPFQDGATCDKCGTVAVNPVPVAAITNEKGEFVIEGIPSGLGIPLVMQVGKWRRQITVDIKPCEDNTFEDPQQMRLPAKKSEGDMPRMALQAGGSDPLGCLLSRMGVDPSEFTGPAENGRIHVFQGQGGELPVTGGAARADTELWNSLANLKKYDVVFLACEGDEANDTKPPAARTAMADYLNLGGRMFATHYHYTWLKNGPPEFSQLADWGTPATGSAQFLVDQQFPKGKALAEWLFNLGATPTKGTLAVTDILATVKNSVKSVRPGAQRWIYDQSNSSPKYFSFNTPVSAKPEDQCGRGVFTDLHLGLKSRTPLWKQTDPVPTVCNNTPLSAQELALEFLLFDLSACVQRDDLPPIIPN
jgi:hypothetical protein